MVMDSLARIKEICKECNEYEVKLKESLSALLIYRNLVARYD